MQGKTITRLVMFGWLLSLLGVGSASGCGDTQPKLAPLGSQPTAALPAGKGDSPPVGADRCPVWAGPVVTGHLAAGAADEVSGLVASRQQPGIFWAVEDKGNDPTLFATDRRGRDLGRWTLQGAKNRDWEALALGPGLPGSRDVLYVADMGDNDGTRESARVFRLEEPVVEAAAPSTGSWSLGAQGPRVDTGDFEELKLVYADEVPRNVEAFVVDPVDGAAWALSRAREGAETEVLRVIWPTPSVEPGATSVGALEVALTEAQAPGLAGEVVAADVSRAAVVVLFKSGATRVWARGSEAGEPAGLLETLRGTSCEAPGAPQHTRSLALTDQGWPPAWATAPEGKHAPLVRVEEAAPCPVAGEVELAGRVRDASARELSGVVASRSQDVLWTHNDGDRNMLMAVSTTGEVLQTFWLQADPAVDWEDIALGPGPSAGPEPGVDYVYAADTGDNALDRKHVQVIRFPEPAVDVEAALGANEGAGGALAVQPIEDYEVFELEYPGKAEHDAEGLLVDPLDGTVYLFTKRNHDDETTRVYAARTLDPLHKTDLELVLTETEAEHLHGAVVAADVTPEGDWVGLLTRYGEARFWFRPVPEPGMGPAAPLWHALQRAPCRGPIAPGQEEALAFSRARDGYWMIPEGEDPGVFFVPFVSTDPSRPTIR